MKVKTFLASLLYVLSIQVKTSLESDVDASSSAKFGELPVLEDQDIFTKTSSVNVDANNYGKVLVNLCRFHDQIRKSFLFVSCFYKFDHDVLLLCSIGVVSMDSTHGGLAAVLQINDCELHSVTKCVNRMMIL